MLVLKAAFFFVNKSPGDAGRLKFGRKKFGNESSVKKKSSFQVSIFNTVDGWNPKQPPGMVLNPINNGKNYQPQLVRRISAINSRKVNLR